MFSKSIQIIFFASENPIKYQMKLYLQSDHLKEDVKNNLFFFF